MVESKLACTSGYLYIYNTGFREETSEVLEKTAYTVCPMGTGKTGSRNLDAILTLT